MAETEIPPPAPFQVFERPSRTRYLVLTFLCSLAFVLYLDRICISQAVESIQRDLGLTNSQMGIVLASFTLAYGLFEVPTGRWGDVLGARRVLTRISIWWSIFTALTGVAFNFYSLVAVRFLFGAGEAGAYPNAARILSIWFPAQERGRAQAALQTAALIGGAASPVCAAYMISAFGWRAAFVVFGSTGIVWAALFYFWFRDDPAQHPAVNSEELSVINAGRASVSKEHAPIPWARVFSSSCILLLATIMTCSACNSYIYFSWFPKYLQAGRSVEAETAGWLASLVLFGSAIGNLSGGLVTDLIVRYCPSRMLCRRVWGFLSCAVAALLLGIAIRCESPYATSSLAAASCLAMNLTLSNWWSCSIEVSGRHVGAIFGLMNGLGAFGAMGSQLMFGKFADWRAAAGYTGRAQWDPAFDVVVGVLMVAAVCWLFVDSSRSIDPEA